MIRPLAIGLSSLALLAPLAALAAPYLHPVDRAAVCMRRGDAECALREAEAALRQPDAPSSVRREALTLRAVALALVDRAADAAEACAALHEVWPGWRPTPDADPRVAAAYQAARAARLAASLPDVLAPGPAPTPPPAAAKALLPPPLLYAPDALVALDLAAAAPRPFTLSFGAGVGLTTGAAADRHAPGIHVAVDLGYTLAEPLDLWLQVTLALLPLDDALPVEPAFPRRLTALSGALGARLARPLVGDLDLVAALGVGYGAFGLRSLGDAAGPALHVTMGLRYALDDDLAVRLDLAPCVVWPSAQDVGAGGHIALVLRGQTRL